MVSAWGKISDAHEKNCVVRDGDSADMLKRSLSDIQEEFVRKHKNFLAVPRIFFSFLFRGCEKNIELIKTLRLCELWNAARMYQAED